MREDLNELSLNLEAFMDCHDVEIIDYAKNRLWSNEAALKAIKEVTPVLCEHIQRHHSHPSGLRVKIAINLVPLGIECISSFPFTHDERTRITLALSKVTPEAHFSVFCPTAVTVQDNG